jgi:acyl carrier protein
MAVESREAQAERRNEMDELKKVILDYVAKEYLEDGDDRQIGEDTPLITGGIVDSFSMVSLKRFLERRYSIQIPDAEATPQVFDTVTSIAELVKKFTKT